MLLRRLQVPRRSVAFHSYSWSWWTRIHGLITTRQERIYARHAYLTTHNSTQQVIPQPRCLNGVVRSLQAGSYKEPLEVYEDLSLVFLNALYYNEPTSQIYKDADTLKVCRGFLYFL